MMGLEEEVEGEASGPCGQVWRSVTNIETRPDARRVSQDRATVVSMAGSPWLVLYAMGVVVY
jgi:hypothetical protein